MGQTSFSLGRLARDGKTGKWSWKKSNRKKGLLDWESDSKSQKAARKSTRKSAAAAAAKSRQKDKAAREKAKTQARFQKAKDKAAREQSFKERAQARNEEVPTPTVTVTGVWGNGTARPQTRVIQGQVVQAKPTQRAIGSGQGVSRMCGGKTRDGGQCLRTVAPGSACPHHPSAQRSRPREGAAK